MATATISKKNNLESFACLWLDQDVNKTEDNLQTQNELRQVINYLQTFDNTKDCEQYIRHIQNEKIVLIVSGSFGRDIVPRLHTLSQLTACYVFCQNKTANEQWARNYHKIKGVFIKRSDLVNAITRDQNARAKVEEGASIAVISHSTKSLESRNAIFMWFQLFIEVLLRMHHKSSDRKELMDLCKKNYQGNKQEMQVIMEFEKSYKPSNAIWWYTRESCFYRMMNKALRVQDYDVLFAFRFFITDVAKQLRSEHDNFIRTSETRGIMRVFRGQAISKDELNLMKNSIGEFLSMNSFLSTSRNRSTAVHFAHSVTVEDGHQPILFEIEINPRLKTKAFANVNQMSYFEKEDEVLIMLGALFRIDKVSQDTTSDTWVANVSLASEDDYHLKEIFLYMKEKIGDDTDLGSLGKILYEMGEYEQAQKYNGRAVEESRLTQAENLITLAFACGKNDESYHGLEYANEALQIQLDILGEEDVKTANGYRCVGDLHAYCGNYEESLVNLTKAVDIMEKMNTTDLTSLSRAYRSLAATLDETQNYHLSLKYLQKALETQQKYLPNDHPDVAMTFNNIGVTYANKDEWKKAVDYYQKSLDISRKTLPPTHVDIIRTENNIRYAREQMNQ